MKKLILIALLTAIGWQAYAQYQAKQIPVAEAQEEVQVVSNPIPHPSVDTPSSHTFTCDGRTYCSQMTSCEEATFFLRNCPGTKMDGNHDGVPCEMQWCKS
jgi:hypothetical protein